MRVIPAALVMLAATSAYAERADVSVGNHANYGRIVIPLNGSGPAAIVQRDNQILITFPAAIDVAAPPRVPRNVALIEGGRGTATITIASGARLKQSQNARSLVIDVLDPIAGTRSTAMRNLRLNAAFGRPEPEPERPGPAPQPIQPPPVSTPAADPAPAVEQAAAPSSAPQLAPSPTPPRSADPMRVPAGPDVGAVAFRRGEFGVVVFDDRVDLPQIDGERPMRAKLRRMQGGTILTVPLEPDEALMLRRDQHSWAVSVGSGPSRPASQTMLPDGIAFQFDQPGRAMTVSDPATGQTLLIGTVRGADDERIRVEERRSAPGYAMVPTWLGLVVEVTADATDLRVVPSGFALHVPDRTTTATASAENPFAIPDAASGVLMQRLDAQVAGAATLPPRSRGKERVAAARTMLALGMAPEAQALLILASNDDPAIAADPLVAALTGIAAILAGRPGEAGGLDHAGLPASGDVALWRGVRDLAQGKPAPLVANGWTNLANYTDAVRRRVAPTVIEAAINAGAAIPAADVQGPRLAYARALKLGKSGEIDPALAAFDAIEQSRDERESVRAAMAATELRLSSGKIAPAEAADRLERQATRWRGDAQELTIRLRLAELRTQAGEWRAALESLRQTETLFPDSKERAAGLKMSVFTSVLNAKQETLNPLEIVTIAGDFAECIPPGGPGERLAALLAEKLTALDLPARAMPVLQNLIDKTEAPGPKAEFAIRLAQLRLDSGEFGKAETILSAINPSVLAPERADQRTVLLARAQAGRGDPAGAAGVLASSVTPESAELRASLLAKAGDWKGSLRALEQLAATAVPASGDLTDAQQDLLLRQATAAVQASEPDAIRKLRQFDARMKPPRAELFRLLTASAVESADDLPRAARELAMSRALPDRLEALKLR